LAGGSKSLKATISADCVENLRHCLQCKSLVHARYRKWSEADAGAESSRSSRIALRDLTRRPRHCASSLAKWECCALFIERVLRQT